MINERTWIRNNTKYIEVKFLEIKENVKIILGEEYSSTMDINVFAHAMFKRYMEKKSYGHSHFLHTNS